MTEINPFYALSRAIGTQYAKGARQSRNMIMQQHLENAIVQQIHTEKTALKRQDKPTPASTGAPIPGYRKRGPITPSTTGAPVPGTLKNNTATHPITGAKVPRTPVKPKGAKPTAPGTRPKKK